MNKFLIVNRRKQGMSLQDFNYEWGTIHVALMLTTPSAMAFFRRYVQGYAAPELGGVPLAYPLSAENWDGFASLSFETLENLAASMEQEDYLVRARPHDFSDPKMVVEVTGEDVILDELDAPEEEAVKLVHFLRRDPGLSQEAFASAWRDEYASKVLDVTKGAVKRYVQNPALMLEGSVFEGTAYGNGLFGAYGGIEELCFSSRDEFRAFCAQATLDTLKQAGQGLIEEQGSFSMVVTDRLRFVSTRGPDGASAHCWAPPGIEVRSELGRFSGAIQL